jgi:hypothetical protein
MNNQVAESIRRSRADQRAAELAAAAQESADQARIERLENRVYGVLRALGWLTATLWLVGLAVLLGWRYLP